MNALPSIEISVVIGRVSTEDSERILETIVGFRAEAEGIAYEIVIVDRMKDALSQQLANDFPEVKHITCAAELSLPEMRTVAFEASKGAIVAVTEDHCVPAPGWLRLALDTFTAGGKKLVAIGGTVVNGIKDRGFDWATFLCEYSYFSPPVVEGVSRVLPGMNVAYRREVLAAVPRETLTSGFWETTLHNKLIADDGILLSLNSLVMYHCKRFSFSLFARQRFIYSKYYAGLRSEHSGAGKRLTMATASLALPPVLLWRMFTASRQKNLLREFLTALPSLSLLVIIWSIGESVGALAGPGNALARIE